MRESIPCSNSYCRNLLQALALLTAAALVSGNASDDLVETSYNVMHDYRRELEATAAETRASTAEGDVVMPAPVHGGQDAGRNDEKLDVFAILRCMTIVITKSA